MKAEQQALIDSGDAVLKRIAPRRPSVILYPEQAEHKRCACGQPVGTFSSSRCNSCQGIRSHSL